MGGAELSAGLGPLSRVQLRGLAASELNGRVATVLTPGSAAEAQRLLAAGRVKVSHFPRPLSIKACNLAPASAPRFTVERLGHTLLGLVVGEEASSASTAAASVDAVGSDVGAVDFPLQFAEALWLRCLEGLSTPSPQRFSGEAREAMLNTPGHWLYWLQLWQLGHHVVLESCDGVWRVFQAMQLRGHGQGGPSSDQSLGRRGRAAATPPTLCEFSGVIVQSGGPRARRGYTAASWAAAPPSASDRGEEDWETEGVKEIPPDAEEPPPDAGGVGSAAHRRFGCGRELGWSDAAEFLASILDLQRQTQEIARRLCASSGCPDDASASLWASELLAAEDELADFCVAPSRPGTPRSCPGYAESDSVWVFSPLGAAQQCDLNMPSQVAFSFMNAYQGLVGEYPTATVFLTALQLIEGEKLEPGGLGSWTWLAQDLRRS